MLTQLNSVVRPDGELKLTNVIGTIREKADESPESTQGRPSDTHKWAKYPKHGLRETTYSQLDYILLSSALANAMKGKVKIERRGSTGGFGHYWVWAEIDLLMWSMDKRHGRVRVSVAGTPPSS
jgi:hypothetical protein